MSGNAPWLWPQGAVGYLEEVARSFDEGAKDGRAVEAVRLLADGYEALGLSVERGNERLIRMTARAEAAEAECARLREERDALRESGQRWAVNVRHKEAECARLRQALEAIANDDTPAFRNAMGQWAERWERHEKVAREALARSGSERSSLTESGSAGLPNTPATDELQRRADEISAADKAQDCNHMRGDS